MLKSCRKKLSDTLEFYFSQLKNLERYSWLKLSLYSNLCPKCIIALRFHINQVLALQVLTSTRAQQKSGQNLRPLHSNNLRPGNNASSRSK